MSASINIAGDDILAAVRAFLQLVMPSTLEVVAALDNSVPMPSAEFIAMTFGQMERLATTSESYGATTTSGTAFNSLTPWRVTVNLDVYSNNAQQYAALIAGLLRSEYAVDNFPPPVTPLYCGEPQQMPFITAEENYLQRWRVELSAQINPITSLNVQTANTLAVGVVSVERTYPP